MKKIIKRNSIIIAIVLLMVLSWSGLSNKYSKSYIDNSIKETAIVYATARGINAVVSVLQSSESSLSFVGGFSVTIGEILDPINDSIERFSQVVSFALVSLVLQKILASIVAQNLFNFLITIFATALIISLYFKQNKYIDFAGKGFVLLTFTKFLFIIVIFLNSITSAYFLNENIDKNHQKLEKFQDGISLYTGQLTKREKHALKNENQDLEQKIVELEESLKAEDTKNSSLKSKKDRQIKIKKSSLNQYYKNCNWWWFDSKNCDAMDITIKDAKSLIADTNEAIKTNQNFRAKIKAEIKKIKIIINTNTDKINDKFEFSLWSKISNISIDITDDTVEKYITNLFNLIVLFILKTIVFPLGFFFLLMKSLKRIWRLNWSNVIKE